MLHRQEHNFLQVSIWKQSNFTRPSDTTLSFWLLNSFGDDSKVRSADIVLGCGIGDFENWITVTLPLLNSQPRTLMPKQKMSWKHGWARGVGIPGKEQCSSWILTLGFSLLVLKIEGDKLQFFYVRRTAKSNIGLWLLKLPACWCARVHAQSACLVYWTTHNISHIQDFNYTRAFMLCSVCPVCFLRAQWALLRYKPLTPRVSRQF